MSAWVSLIPPLFGALAIVAALGLPTAFALGARGISLALVTVPAAFAVITVASIALPLIGLPWNSMTAIAVAIVVGLLLLLGRRWLGSTKLPVERVTRFWPIVAAAAIGGAAIGVSLVIGLKGPDHVSQSYDAIFHLNAVRFVLDTGSGSPFDMTLATAPGAAVYYPTPWHALVALVVQLTNASIPLATNAVMMLVACVIWPVGAVALGRAVAGPSRRATLAAGILAAAFPAFPLLLVRYGVLYPNLLATALIPYALVALLALLNLGPARRSFTASTATTVVFFVGALGAMASAHPNAFFAFAILGTLAVFAAAVRSWKRAGVSGMWHRTGIAGGLTLLCAVLLFAWSRATTSDNGWVGDRSFAAAVWDAFGSSPRLEGHAWILTVLIVGGITIAILRRRHRWLVVGYLVLLALFGLANGMPESAWRTAIIGLWYNDAWRIAAMFPLVTLPLATLALTALSGWLETGIRRWQRAFTSDSPVQRLMVTGGALVLALAATQGSGTFAAVQAVSSRYDPVDQPKLLSVDEQLLLEQLDELVPEDTVLAANPWNGGSLAYAFSGRQVLAPHTGGIVSPEALELTSTLAEGGDRVCQLAAKLNVEFVLDFGRDYIFPGTPRAEPFEGISGIEESSILHEIAREGDAVLYEITGCER